MPPSATYKNVIASSCTPMPLIEMGIRVMKYVALHKPMISQNEICSPIPLNNKLTIAKVQSICTQVKPSAPKRERGLLSHTFNACTSSCKKKRILFANGLSHGIAMLAAGELVAYWIYAGTPNGRAIAIPVIPTKRSTTSEAKQIAWSNPRWIAPANRTTSPPMVVGRKLDENSMAKVKRMDWLEEMPVPADRINTCQRPATAKREIMTKISAKTKRHQAICPAAEAISDQPC